MTEPESPNDILLQFRKRAAGDELLTQVESVLTEQSERLERLEHKLEETQKESTELFLRLESAHSSIAKLQASLDKRNLLVLSFAPNLELTEQTVRNQTAINWLPMVQPMTYEEIEQVKLRLKEAMNLTMQVQAMKKRTLQVRTKDSNAVETAKRFREENDPLRKREVKREKAKLKFENKIVEKLFNNIKAAKPSLTDEQCLERAQKQFAILKGEGVTE
jgi:hypothetical protein